MQDELTLLVETEPDCAATVVDCEDEIVAACQETSAAAVGAAKKSRALGLKMNGDGAFTSNGRKWATLFLRRVFGAASPATVKLAAETSCATW